MQIASIYIVNIYYLALASPVFYRKIVARGVFVYECLTHRLSGGSRGEFAGSCAARPVSKRWAMCLGADGQQNNLYCSICGVRKNIDVGGKLGAQSTGPVFHAEKKRRRSRSGNRTSGYLFQTTSPGYGARLVDLNEGEMFPTFDPI